MLQAITFAASALASSALAWFIFFLVALAVMLWFLSWLLFPETEPVPVGKTLEGLTGMDPQMAGKLAPFGVRTDRDLIRLAPRGQQELESQLGLHHGEYDQWRREVLAKWRDQYLPQAFREIRDISPDPELGGVYTRRPKESDDLTKLTGVDKVTASRLNHAGIYTFEQLRLLMPEQRACVKQKFNLSGFDFDSVPEHGVTAQWLAFLNENPNPPVAHSSQPLTNASTKSNVTTTAQSDDDSPEQVSFASERTPAQHDHHHRPTDSDAKIVSSSFASSQALKSASAGNQTLDAQPNADNPTSNSMAQPIPQSRLDPELGRVYTAPPPHRDELTLLDGISAATEKQLNDAGLFTIDQIRSLSPIQQEHFRRRFNLPTFNFSQWISPGSVADESFAPDVANGYVSSVETPKTVTGFAARQSRFHQPAETTQPQYASSTCSDTSEPESSLGCAYGTKPADVDELELLPHIDAETARTLNQAGIYKFDQLTDMTLAQQTQFRQQFGLQQVNFAEWQRLVFAWSRGVKTSVDLGPAQQSTGWLHSVRLPVVAPGVFDGQQLVAYPEQVVFCGSDPERWGKPVPQAHGEVGRSLAASDVRTDINYVRVRRLDTRESVVTEVTKSHLFAPGSHNSSGWNGLCEAYFGARHLGIYAQHLPTEVETKLGFGGWGFGHQDDQVSDQAFAWAGRIIPATVFEISVGRVGPAAGTVVFRSSKPAIWNQQVRLAKDHWAMPVANVPHPVSYVRMMRTDTGQGVIVRTDKAGVTCRSASPNCGWNGLNEHFYGVYHLGVYCQSAPQQVEIVYGEGGWGFGHLYNDHDRQAFGWAGQAIPETVFEISLLEHVPSHLRHELLEM